MTLNNAITLRKLTSKVAAEKGIPLSSFYKHFLEKPILTLVLRRGFATTPQTVFAPVLKNAQPRSKIAPGTSKFILSPHFSEKKKKFEPTPSPGVEFQSWEVGRGLVQSRDFKIGLF